jgi:hypothetical protein
VSEVYENSEIFPLIMSEYFDLPRVVLDRIYLASAHRSIPLYKLCKLVAENFDVYVVPITADDLIKDYCSGSPEFDFHSSSLFELELLIENEEK